MKPNSACWQRPSLHDSDDHARFIEAARSLPIGRDKVVCVTLGKRGVLALVDGEPLIVPGRAVKASTPPAPAIVLSARWQRSSPAATQSATH